MVSLTVSRIWITATTKTHAKSVNIPVRRLAVWLDTKPISHVMVAPPSVPHTKSGVARRVAVGPKVRVKRDRFVGNTDEAPNPDTAAPILSHVRSPAERIN